MRSIIRLAFVIFGLSVTVDAAVAGQKDVMEGGVVTVRSGVASTIKALGYCDKPFYTAVSGFAEHGKISGGETKGRLCGKSDYPITRIIYTSEAGFTGVDHVRVFLIDRVYAITITVIK